MKLFKKMRKGFTLIELVVVIAVIAILSAVSVVSYVTITNRAKQSNDQHLVDQVNISLQAAEITKKPATMHDALTTVEEDGYKPAKFKTEYTGHEFAYNMEKNRFVLFKDGKVTYPKDMEVDSGKEYQLWRFADDAGTFTDGFSHYLRDGATATSVTSNAGIDVGNNSGITSVNYSTADVKKPVVIRTNSAATELNIDALNSEIHHYGWVGNVNVEKVAPASYDEYGRVAGVAFVKQGHVSVKTGGEITTIVVDSSSTTAVTLNTAGTGKVGTVIASSSEILDAVVGTNAVNTAVVATAEEIEEITTSTLYNKELNKYYEDFHLAFSEAQSNQTLVLIRDTSVQYTDGAFIVIPEEFAITFDLNGHILYGVSNNTTTASLIQNDGTLAIKDTTDLAKDGSSSGKITNNAAYTAHDNGTASLYSFATSTITNTGILNIESGTIESTSTGGASYAVDSASKAGAFVTMTGGKLLCVDGDSALRCTNKSGALVSGGVLESRNAWGVVHQMYSGNTVTLSGGKIIYENLSACPLVIGAYDGNNGGYTGKMILSGIEFDGQVGLRTNTTDEMLEIDSSKYNFSESTTGTLSVARKYFSVKNK